VPAGAHACSYAGADGVCSTQGDCSKSWIPSSSGASGCQALPSNIDCCVTASSLTASTALNRAYQWVQAKLPYCQSPNGAQVTRCA
jgi:hypothetical protein